MGKSLINSLRIATFSFCSKTSEDVWSVGSCKDSIKDTLPSPSSEPSDEDSIGTKVMGWVSLSNVEYSLSESESSFLISISVGVLFNLLFRVV